jgi:NodT family efflux transporter outer membrane factor (OMF) lipoprotein
MSCSNSNRNSSLPRRTGGIGPIVGALLTAGIALSGCMVGPSYVTPTAPVADAWSDFSSASASKPVAEAAWWKNFGDPLLDSLVEQAMAQNLTLRQAGLRVIQARAQRGIAVGQFFPQTQQAVGQASYNRISKNAPTGGGDRTYGDYAIALEAVWELDFWGKFRRGIESADASLEASVADYDDVLIILIAEVASDYVLIRSLQEQIEFTQSNVTAQQDTLELTTVRFNAGGVSELDVARARATLSDTQSLIPPLEDSLRQTTLALCVLLGRTPSDLEQELGGTKPIPTVPPEIALGVPAELLRRRPDIRRAERNAAALSAQIGAATADLFPSVSIQGVTGFETSSASLPGWSPHAKNLFDANSFQGFIGLDVAWPILNYGRIHNNIRVADAQFQEAVVAYQNLVLEAAREVEAGLSSFLRSREQAAFLAESVTASQRTVELSIIQYRQGATDFLSVNQAQVDLVQRQNSLVAARANVAQGAITTYRALGGGWETRPGTDFVPQQTIDEMRARTNWGDILAPDYAEHKDFLLFPRPTGDAPLDGSGNPDAN